jgi:hypothetical protein
MTDTAPPVAVLILDHPGATASERLEADCRRWCAANHLAIREVHVDRGVSGHIEREQTHRDGFTASLNTFHHRRDEEAGR